MLMYFILRLFVRVCLYRDLRRLYTGLPSLRDRVVSASAPRVARQDALEREPAAFEEAVFLDGLDAIVGASGHIAAAFPDERRQCHLIEPNQQDQELSGQLGDVFHDVLRFHRRLYVSCPTSLGRSG